MSTRENIKEHVGRAHKGLSSSPLIMWFLGALCLVLWACATITQISTSEYLASGTNQVVSSMQWAVFIQPWLLLTGQGNITDRTAWAYGWIVEFFTLAFSMALIPLMHKIGSVNSFLAKATLIAGGILLIVNSIADYQSSPGSNDLVRFLIALALGLIVTVGLPLGVGLIEYGCEQY